MVRKRKETIHFSRRRHTKLGILSTLIGIAVTIGFIVISAMSSASKGQGGLFLGVVGIFLSALSILGFVFSYKAFREKDTFYLFPTIGVILNGIMLIVLLILYILGLAL